MTSVLLVIAIVAVVAVGVAVTMLILRRRARGRGAGQDALTRARQSGSALSGDYVRRENRRRRKKKDFADKTSGSGVDYSGSSGGCSGGGL